MANHLCVGDHDVRCLHRQDGFCYHLHSFFSLLFFCLLLSVLLGVVFPLIDKATHQLSLDSMSSGYLFLRQVFLQILINYLFSLFQGHFSSKPSFVLPRGYCFLQENLPQLTFSQSFRIAGRHRQLLTDSRSTLFEFLKTYHLASSMWIGCLSKPCPNYWSFFGPYYQFIFINLKRILDWGRICLSKRSWIENKSVLNLSCFFIHSIKTFDYGWSDQGLADWLIDYKNL